MAFNKILITGGAGFLGSNFALKTSIDYPDCKITILDKLTYAGDIANLGPVKEQIDFVEGDILDPLLVDQLISNMDLVVHFAAETHNDRSLSNPEIFFKTNILGTHNLVKSALTNEVHFHHVSTDEVFGDMPIHSKEKFTEESAYKPSSPYSASKAGSDHLVRSFVRSFGLKATITNCSNNFGINQHSEKFIPQSIRSVLDGSPISLYGSGENIRDWIHVDDHTDGIWAAIRNGRRGETYLLGGDNEISNLELSIKILRVMGKKEDFVQFVPDRLGHDRRYAIDFSKAASELGWSPRKADMAAEIEQLVDFYSSKYKTSDRKSVIE
jgi:dTDP-glucose 4,6-dehydratase